MLDPSCRYCGGAGEVADDDMPCVSLSALVVGDVVRIYGTVTATVEGVDNVVGDTDGTGWLRLRYRVDCANDTAIRGCLVAPAAHELPVVSEAVRVAVEAAPVEVEEAMRGAA
jgi:hypothetical protein